jgi:hypothetical protein
LISISINEINFGRNTYKMNTTKLVPALARGAALLDVVSKSQKSLTVTQIAATMNIPKVLSDKATPISKCHDHINL